MIRSESKESLVKSYLEKCQKKIDYHFSQARRARGWMIYLNLITVGIAGIQSVVMTILGSYAVDTKTVAIVGGVFGLVLILSSRIERSYNFEVLGVLHDNTAENFNELRVEFLTSSNEEVEENIVKFVNVENKNHLLHVNNSRSIMCCTGVDV